MVLDGATADRLATQVDDEELAGGRSHFVWQRGRADRRVEMARRAPVELGDVLGQAVPRVAVLRIDRGDLDAGRAQQPLHLAHGRYESLPLPGAQRDARPSRWSWRCPSSAPSSSGSRRRSPAFPSHTETEPGD